MLIKILKDYEDALLVAQAFSPSTMEAEERWSVPGQSGPHTETVLEKTKPKMTVRTKVHGIPGGYGHHRHLHSELLLL